MVHVFAGRVLIQNATPVPFKTAKGVQVFGCDLLAVLACVLSDTFDPIPITNTTPHPIGLRWYVFGFLLGLDTC